MFKIVTTNAYIVTNVRLLGKFNLLLIITNEVFIFKPEMDFKVRGKVSMAYFLKGLMLSMGAKFGHNFLQPAQQTGLSL